MIIDFHTHIFPDKIASYVIPKLENTSGIKAFTKGTAISLMESMKKAGVDISIVLPVATDEKQVETINDVAARTNEQFEQTGIFSFGAIHPATDNINKTLKTIKSLGLKGIKLHPDYQKTFFDDIRYLRIIEKACELDMIIVVHAGIDIGMPTPIHCSPRMSAKILDEIAPKKMVLAHMGGWCLWDEVEEYIIGRDVYLDTSFSIGPIHYRDTCTKKAQNIELLKADDFKRMILNHGTNKIIFGTDSPWGGQSKMIKEFFKTPLSSNDREKILYQNALKLLEA